MIEAYLFHGMFALQILLGSVLIPRRLLQLVDQSLARNPPEPSGAAWIQRTRKRYRLANAAVAVIGVIMMGAFFSYMRQADWNDGPVEAVLPFFFLLQCLPFAAVAIRAAYSGTAPRNSLPGDKRKAVLQRRGLFDFVSPFVVGLTLLCYLLFVALVFYIGRAPFDGFAGVYVNLGIVTAAYAVTAFFVYHVLYRRKSNPRHSHAQRMQEMGSIVKVLVYSCLAGVVALMSNFLLILLDRQRLEPFAMCAYFVVIALWIYRSMYAAPGTAAPGQLHTGAAR